MAKDTNSSTNLLRDIGLSKGGRDVNIQYPYQVTETRSTYRLGGLTTWRVAGIKIEIELVNSMDLARSVIYLTNDSPLYVFIPKGTYALRLRFLSAPGRYQASVTFQRVGLTERLRLYAAKGANVLQRGPSAIWRVLQQVTSQRRSVVAMRLSGVNPGPVPNSKVRPLLRAPCKGKSPSVSIIIPTRDRVDLIRPCIDSLMRLEGVDWNIVVVDNGSVDLETLKYLSEIAVNARIRVIRIDMPFNFSKLCNAGARLATTDALLFLNDDVEALDGNWLRIMSAWLNDAGVGTVGARLLYPSQDLQHAGIATNLVPGPGHPWRSAPPDFWRTHALTDSAGEVDAVTGACLLVRRKDFEDIGGFDEDAFAISLNDVDLCLRLKQKGLKSVFEPAATLIHKEGQSRPDDNSPAEYARRRKELREFFKRYSDFARESCFYPPNLRRDTDQGLPF